MKTRISRTLATAIAGGFLIAAGSAQDQPSVRIDVDDLDLSRPEVAADLYSRIQSSAQRLCRDNSAPWNTQRNATWKRCVSAAVDDAVKQADAPALTALHESKERGNREFADLKR